MAYTYDDFLKAANRANMLKQFDSKDLEVTRVNPEYGLSMLRLMQDNQGAVSPEARLLAGEAMNQLRSNYNVQTAGTTGITAPEMDVKNETTQTPAVDEAGGTPGQFQYDREDEYQALLSQISNPGGFRYDPHSDPGWSAYRKAYLREGDRATQDALARASAATGGVPSSYAVMAAQQAGANYADKLSDTLPALEQQAYERFLQNLGTKQDAFSAIQADRADAYGKWIDAYNMLMKNIELANTENTSSIPAEDLAQMQTAYPTGIISDETAWNQLVALYGEGALKDEGFSYQAGAKPESEPMYPLPGMDFSGLSLPQTESTALEESAALTKEQAIYFLRMLKHPDSSVPDEVKTLGLQAVEKYKTEPWVKAFAAALISEGGQEKAAQILYENMQQKEIDNLHALIAEGSGTGIPDWDEERVLRLVENGVLTQYVENGILKWKKGPNFGSATAWIG